MRDLIRNSRFVRAALSLGVVFGVGATGTYALWTDAVPVSGTTISTGTINLQVNNQDSVTNFTTLSLTNMVPGNSAAGVLTVTNTGSAPLRYYVTSKASNDGKSLGPTLQMKVTNDAAVSGSSPTTTCAGTALATPTLAATDTNFLGTAGSQRTLAAGGSEKLCIQATLPTSADSSVQGATTNLTFSFNGTSF